MEPWNERTDDSRGADTVVNFILFCEDGVCEPLYFKRFEIPQKVHINIIGNQGNNLKNLFSTYNYFKDKGLLKYENGKPVLLVEEGTHVWCVFDYDYDPTSENQEHEFNSCINSATDANINVAWSNDAFELWVLLHFEEVGEVHKYREYYYTRLTEIFKGIPNPNDILKAALKHATFNYKQDLKTSKAFRGVVRPELFERTAIAIERAKELDRGFENSHLPHHLQSPCTKVYRLVEILRKFGE